MKKPAVEEAVEQLKTAISEMKEVKSFTLEQNGTNYEIIVESKDGTSCNINLTMMDIYYYICKYGINAFCFIFPYEIGYNIWFNIQRYDKALFKDMKNTEFQNAINKALLNAYEDRDKIIEEDKRKENKDMNNEENRTLEGKSNDYMMGASCAAQAFSEVDKGRFRKSDEYDLILNSYYKGFEICKAYIKGNTNDKNREAIEKIMNDMDELADFFDGFLNGYADATLYYYEQGKKEREE